MLPELTREENLAIERWHGSLPLGEQRHIPIGLRKRHAQQKIALVMNLLKKAGPKIQDLFGEDWRDYVDLTMESDEMIAELGRNVMGTNVPPELKGFNLLDVEHKGYDPESGTIIPTEKELREEELKRRNEEINLQINRLLEEYPVLKVLESDYETFRDNLAECQIDLHEAVDKLKSLQGDLRQCNVDLRKCMEAKKALAEVKEPEFKVPEKFEPATTMDALSKQINEVTDLKQLDEIDKYLTEEHGRFTNEFLQQMSKKMMDKRLELRQKMEKRMVSDAIAREKLMKKYEEHKAKSTPDQITWKKGKYTGIWKIRVKDEEYRVYFDTYVPVTESFYGRMMSYGAKYDSEEKKFYATDFNIALDIIDNMDYFTFYEIYQKEEEDKKRKPVIPEKIEPEKIEITTSNLAVGDIVQHINKVFYKVKQIKPADEVENIQYELVMLDSEGKETGMVHTRAYPSLKKYFNKVQDKIKQEEKMSQDNPAELPELKAFAEKHGFIINPKRDMRRFLNVVKANEGMCPCLGTKRGRCPCQESIQEVKSDGRCFCNLFLKGE